MSKYQWTSLQAISKKHLTPNYGVASLFKMLTYSHVCCAFSSARALSLNVICFFEMACSKYLFLGKELGGRSQDSEFYDAEGFVLSSRIAESPPFLKGIDRLIKGISTYRVAVMCSEENPANRHRRLLVGRVLAKEVWGGSTVLQFLGNPFRASLRWQQS